MNKEAPIGVFDSGVGGLTVVSAIRKQLPNESIVYLGDTARVPYGTKSSDVVKRYAQNCTKFLESHGVKLVVVACNTASAVALQSLKQTFSIPMVGVIEPGAKLAATQSQRRRIGVIGTEATIASESYQHALGQYAPDALVFSKSCPLFVPLAEEMMQDHAVTHTIAKEYLADFLEQQIDVLVLGCTHYPLLLQAIQRAVGSEVQVLDSATAVASEIVSVLKNEQLTTTSKDSQHAFFATDVSQRVLKVGRAFLGDALGAVTLVDL